MSMVLLGSNLVNFDPFFSEETNKTKKSEKLEHSAPLVFSTQIKKSMDFPAFGVFVHINEFRISREKYHSSGFQNSNPQKTSFLCKNLHIEGIC